MNNNVLKFKGIIYKKWFEFLEYSIVVGAIYYASRKTNNPFVFVVLAISFFAIIDWVLEFEESLWPIIDKFKIRGFMKIILRIVIFIVVILYLYLFKALIENLV